MYGKVTMSRNRVFEWNKTFNDGREEVDEHPGHPSTLKTDRNLNEIVRDDRRLSIRMGASMSISKSKIL